MSEVIFDFKLTADKFGKSVYDKVNCREYCNIKRVFGFIKHQLGISYNGIKRYEHLPFQTELDQIIKFKDTWNKKNKCFVVGHHLAKHKWGRVNPSGSISLSILHRPTRHGLADEFYVDLDMVNCQPTIMVEILKQHNITKPILTKYALNPKKYRERIMELHKCSKDVAKTLPITLLFGGSYDGWIKENNIQARDKLKTFVDMENEMKELIEIIWANNKETIYKDVITQNKKKWKTTDEAKRGVMGLWCQSVERIIQETCISWLVDNKDFKIAEIVPCQDGIMILKELFYKGITDDLTAIIINKFNINVGWIVKPFDEAIDIPIWDETKNFEEWKDAISEKMLAEAFLTDYSDYIAKQDDMIYVYYEDKYGGRWYNETDAKNRNKLTIYISENLYEKFNAEINAEISLDEKELAKLLDLLRSHTSKGSCLKDVFTHIFTKVREVKNLFNNKPYLFPFNNGVYELLTGEFRNYKFDDYLTLTNGWDWEEINYEIEEHQKNKELLCKIIEDIDDREDHRLFKLQTIASGLDGRGYQLLHYWVGSGGNGKSLLLSLLKIILGNDFYYQAPAGLTKELSRPNNASPDAYKLMFKRWCNFTEVKGTISLGVLRTLTGGGDFHARLLHSNPIQFKSSATFSMEFNNPPEFDGKPEQADYRRGLLHRFQTNFTSGTKYPEKIGKTINGVIWKEANSTYETEEFHLKMRPYFFDLLAGIYKHYANADKGIVLTIPKSALDETEKFINDQNLFQKVFNDKYEKVNWTDDDVKEKSLKYKDFWEEFNSSQEFKTLRTNGQRAEYSRDNCYEWLRSNFTSKRDKNKVEWMLGVVKKYKDEDLEDEEIVECKAVLM
jgi:phage/plasmid-associated DNA primase